VNKTKFYDGFLWVDPSASCSDLVDAVLPTGETVSDSTFPCRLTMERRRVKDPATGRRITRDWRIAHFLLWRDGEGSPDMGRDVSRTVFIDARACGADQIVVHGRIALVASRNMEFHQFGVRDISSIPASF
jgi:hypothetical protein